MVIFAMDLWVMQTINKKFNIQDHQLGGAGASYVVGLPGPGQPELHSEKCQTRQLVPVAVALFCFWKFTRHKKYKFN